MTIHPLMSPLTQLYQQRFLYKAVEEAFSYSLPPSSAREMGKSSLGSENTIFIPNE